MQILDRKLLRDLWWHRGQAAMIIIVIACGVATAVMSFSVLRSLDQTRTQYYEQYRFADVFASLARAPESVAATIGRIPGVAQVQTRIVAEITIEIEGVDEPMAGRVLSLPERGEPAVNATFLRQGRTIGAEEANQVVVSETFAQAHGLVPGAHLRVMLGGRAQQLVIVGIALSPEYIYALGPGQIVPDEHRFGVFWMGRQALESALKLKGEFNEISLRLDGSASEADVIERLNRVLTPYGGPGAYGREHQSSHAFLSRMFDQLAGVGRIVPPIFLAVAVFLAFTVLVRLIDTERRNIGLFKSLGVSDRAVGWHYLKFVLVPVTIGIALGLAAGTALGYGLTEIYIQLFHFPFLRYTQDPAIAATAIVVSTAAVVAGALSTVRRAVFLPPAIALAPAAPSAYRRTFGERLAVYRRISQPIRIILRHLARWPLRAAFTVVAMSLAVALQVSMLFSFDALDHMIDVFYARAQRQDVTVVFAKALPGTMADEAMAWPGVLQVEGYHTIPVRLTLRSRSRLVNLTGLRPDASLSRLLDLNLVPVPVPSHGIALSKKLAEVLHGSVGDVLTVETIGHHARFEIPVALLTEQYIGMDSFLELDALNTLLGEKSRLSGVHLLIDPRHMGEFYRTLRDAPVVAGLSQRAMVIDSFRRTMARTLTIIVSFFVGFAGLTALGIAYSSARIILAERERELAVMMALGFSEAEVGTIFIGELATLTILALPLGCVFGRGLGWLIAQRLDTDLYRVPLIINTGTYAVAMLVTLLAATVSILIVARYLSRLDFLAILNARQ